MKKLTIAVFACCLSLAAGGVYAQEMNKDAMGKSDAMKTDSRGKAEMKKDAKKSGAKKDTMAKGDMAKDMNKGGMAKDTKSKDAMKKSEMSGMTKDQMQK